jgi:hypothetical protein
MLVNISIKVGLSGSKKRTSLTNAAGGKPWSIRATDYQIYTFFIHHLQPLCRLMIQLRFGICIMG